MSNPTLMATLGLNTDSFRAGLAASQKSLKEQDVAVKISAAILAEFEQSLSADATKEQIKQLDEMKDAHRRLQVEIKNTARQEAALAAARALAPTMPKASSASAAITVAEGAAEAGGAGISRMGKMELGHVARSLAGSLMAGMPVGRAVEMESPRLLSALGPAAMSAVGGLAGLTAVLGPLALAVGGAAGAFEVYSANERAKNARRAISEIGENPTNLGELDSDMLDDSMGWKEKLRRWHKRNRLDRGKLDVPEGINLPDQNVESARDLDRDAEGASQVIENAKAERRTKTGKLARFFGFGLKRSDVQEGIGKRDAIIGQRDDVLSRDQGFAERAFAGNPAVEADRLKAARDEKITKAEKDQADGKIRDMGRQVALAEQEYQLSMQELTRKQAFQKAELDMEGKINAARRDGSNVAVETARARMEEAKAILDAGEKQGPKFEEHQKAFERAQGDFSDLDREHKIREETLATEKQIADFRGSADAKHIFSLRLEMQLLEKRRELAKPEEQKQIDVQIAQNKSQTYDAERTSIAASNQAHLALLAAGYDHGAEGQMQRLKDRRETLGFEMDSNRQYNIEGQKVWKNGNLGAHQMEEDNELKIAIEELTAGLKEHLSGLQKEGTQIQNRGKQPTLAMRDQQTNDKYDAQKASEERGDNDPASLAQIEKNRGAEHFENAVDESMMTPQEKAERQRHNDSRARAAAGVKSRQDRHAEIEAANNTRGSFDNFFHPQAVTAHEIRKGAENAGKSDKGAWTDANIVKGLKDVETAVKSFGLKNK